MILKIDDMLSMANVLAFDRGKHCYRVAMYCNVEVIDDSGTVRDFGWVDTTAGKICFWDSFRYKWLIERGSFRVVIKKDCESRYS